MGLKDYKAWKLRQQILEVLGITEEQLAYLPKALEIVKELSEKKPVEEPATKVTPAPLIEKPTPEQYVDMFKGDIEEFYPDGRNRN